MVDSAVLLLREHAAPAVTIDAVLARSGAPRGSVYHHFPGGRDEIVVAAVRRAGEFVTQFLDTLAADVTPAEAIQKFGRFWRHTLVDSDYRAGCPVVALAVDHRDDLPAAQAAVDEVFAAWHAALQRLLQAHGATSAQARRRANLAVSAIEGAVVLCRAQRSTVPLDDVCRELATLFDTGGTS